MDVIVILDNANEILWCSNQFSISWKMWNKNCDTNFCVIFNG